MGASRGLLAGLLLLAAAASWFLLRDDGRVAGASVPEALPASQSPSPRTVSLLQPPARLAEPLPTQVATERIERESEPASLDGPAFEELDGEGILQVRVLALESGEPLAEVPLRIETEGGGPVRLRRAVEGTSLEGFVTDEKGRADLIVPAGRELVLHARRGAPLGRSAYQRISSVRAGQYRTVVLELFEAPDRTWCGLVVDGLTGGPVRDAEATLLRGGSESLFVAKPSPDGSLCLELDSILPAALKIEAPGYGRRLVGVVEEHAQPFDAQRIELFPFGVLDVLATDSEGRPFAGLRVQVFVAPEYDPESWRMSPRPDFEARTDEEGRCSLAHIPPNLALTVVGLRQDVARVDWLPEGLQSGQVRPLRWVLCSGRSLRGQVVDQDGVALPEQELWLSRVPPEGGLFQTAQQRQVFVAKADAQGRFLFENVVPGAWWLGPRPSVRQRIIVMDDIHSAFLEPGSADACAPVAVEVNVGEEDQEFNLRATRGLYIEGQALDSQGAPRSGMPIEGRSGQWRFTALTNADGMFRLGPLVSGEYTLAWSGSGVETLVHCMAGARGVRLKVSEEPAERFRIVR